MNDIINWLDINNLIINLNKTKVGHFHQRRKHLPFNVTYNNCIVEEVTSAKFLGITIDNKLTWKPHLNEICTRLSKSAYLLFQLAKKIDTNTLLTY